MNQNFLDYFNSLRGKKAVVLGIGVSNTPLIKLLLENNCHVTACDRKNREQLGDTARELEALGAVLKLGSGYLELPDCDVVFRSPGIRPDIPALTRVRENGGIVTSEMEAFFHVCPCPIIGVSGSDGKTTTTSIIAEILRESGYTVHLGGNIGKPLLAEAGDMGTGDWAVVELSSFQLMTMERSPHIAAITNVSPNHLDVHTSMEEYVWAKRKLFSKQKKGDRLVLNADDKISAGFFPAAGTEVVRFSRSRRADFYLRDDIICMSEDGAEREIVSRDEILLPGLHNAENYMAAFAATRGMAGPDVWKKVARRFERVEHRVEKVRCLDGVTYYNDSIASSPTRTIAGLRAFDQRVILIAGGYDKNIPYDELGREIVTHVKTLVLTGDTAQKIRESVLAAGGEQGELPMILEYNNMRDAVYGARDAAEPGDIVILSPASASFDKYKDFAERGRIFKEIVRGL